MQAVRNFLAKHAKKGKKKPKTNLWFTLPRELRDEIYREALCKRYLIHWPKRWKRGKAMCNHDRRLFECRDPFWTWSGIFWSGHAWMVKRPTFWANVALLLTSKAICQEGIEMMYKESSFCVYMGIQSLLPSRMTPLPSQQLLNRIQNLEMNTCVCATSDLTASANWFQKFNGSDTRRNSCRISFPCYSCLIFYSDHEPFLRACRSLLGFKTVTITMKQQRKDVDGEEVYFERYNSEREDFRAALEPHLGPGRSYNIGHHSIGHHFCLEFRPRKHLEDLQAAPPKSGAQVLRVKEG